MGVTTSDSGSMGPSIQDDIGADLILENREAELGWAAVDVVKLAKGSDSHSFQQLTTASTAVAITTGTAEGDAGTADTLVVAARKATAASKVAWVVQSWQSAKSSMINWASELPSILGRAIADLRDIDALALAAGHANTVGSTGVQLTLEAARLAGTTLRRYKKGGSAGAVWFLHPQQIGDIGQAAIAGTGIALNVLLPQVLTMFEGKGPSAEAAGSYAGFLVGHPVFTSTNIPDMNSATDHGGALIIPKKAWGGVELQAPEYITDSQTNALKLADAHGTWASYGVVEREDLAGVTAISLHV